MRVPAALAQRDPRSAMWGILADIDFFVVLPKSVLHEIEPRCLPGAQVRRGAHICLCSCQANEALDLIF